MAVGKPALPLLGGDAVFALEVEGSSLAVHRCVVRWGVGGQPVQRRAPAGPLVSSEIFKPPTHPKLHIILRESQARVDGSIWSFMSLGQASFWHEGCKPGKQASHPDTPNDLVEERESGKGGVRVPAGGRDVGGWRRQKTEEAHGGLGVWVLLEPGFGEQPSSSVTESRGQRMGPLVWGSCPSATARHRGSVNSGSLGLGPGPTVYGVRDFGQV